MNVKIEGIFQNGYLKPDRIDKETGETKEGDYVVQISQLIKLANGETKNENLDIPIDKSLMSNYQDYKIGNNIEVLCSVYAKDFAPIFFSKAK